MSGPAFGMCSVCGLTFRRLSANREVLVIHGPHRSRCPGGGKPPADAEEAPAANVEPKPPPAPPLTPLAVFLEIIDLLHDLPSMSDRAAVINALHTCGSHSLTRDLLIFGRGR